MLKSKIVQRLLRWLIACLGAGLGMAIALGGLKLYTWLNPATPPQSIYAVGAYIAMALVFGLVFYLLADYIIRRFMDVCSALEGYLDKLTTPQLTASVAGLLAGMAIAALLSQMISLMGASMFTTAFSGILYVVLGVTGFSIGRRRAGTFPHLHMPRHTFRRKAKAVQSVQPIRPKILDASVIIDGRILDVCRTGFLEGELIVPSFVLAELRQVADSADSSRRIRGRRGLDMLKTLQADAKITLRVDETDYSDLHDTDVKLIKLAQDTGGVIVTGDYSLNKVAAVSGVGVLNLAELANALRPVVLPGEELSVQITKQGKEPGQGVGYLPDGTMIVVEGGSVHMGQAVQTVVTSALQTSAGRMIFTKIKADAFSAG